MSDLIFWPNLMTVRIWLARIGDLIDSSELLKEIVNALYENYVELQDSTELI